MQSMQYGSKVQTLTLPIILIFIFLIFVIALLNLAYADLQEKTLYEITKRAPSKEYPHISVGNHPSAILTDPFNDKIYVVNTGDDSVSVIDTENNSKIGEDIKVGDAPSAIERDDFGRIYVTNAGDDSVSVIDVENNSKIGEDIKVGFSPMAIKFDGISKIYVVNMDDSVSVLDISVTNPEEMNTGHNIKVDTGHGIGVTNVSYYDIDTDIAGDKIYVTNRLNDSISVIDAKKYLDTGLSIKVGKRPTDMLTNGITIYVTNRGDDSVSVMDEKNHSKIADDIKVGDRPSAITSSDSGPDEIYVVNMGDDSVSVIDVENNSKIGEDIKVGDAPSAIGTVKDSIYVANHGDDTVSVIDINERKVVAKVMFNIEPLNSGRIECYKDAITGQPYLSPLIEEFYIYFNSQCIAKPNPGFEFLSWQENLNENSTQLLQIAVPPSNWDSILNFFNMRHDKPEATLNATKFGSFTANFKELPPPIPPQYVATLFAVVVSAFIGTWLTPTILGWRKARKQARKLAYYYSQIKNLYNDGKLDSNDIETLDKIKAGLTKDYTKGSINKEQYDLLAEEISINYREIFSKEIDLLSTLSKNGKPGDLSGIQSNIEDAYAKGKINESHHTLLRERVSKFEKNQT